MKYIPSCIRNTNDFLNKINNFKVLKKMFLVTMVVKALFKSIPTNYGIAAVKQKYDNYTKKTIAIKVMITFLALLLTLINFIFNSKFYIQIKGWNYGHNMGSYIRKHIDVRIRGDTLILSLKTNLSTFSVSLKIFLW